MNTQTLITLQPNEDNDESLSVWRQRRQEQLIESYRRLVWGINYKKLSFPVKLHMLVSFGGQFAVDLWWTDGGRSFAVAREGFKRHIMSIFFDEHKFRSFQTQLHKYHFYRVCTINGIETDILVYQHVLFVQQDLDLSKKIVRDKKGNRRRNVLTPKGQRIGPKPQSRFRV